MDTAGYKEAPYARCVDFVKDVGALTKEHSDLMRRRTGPNTTLLASLAHATQGAQLQYLFNGPRYIARNPRVEKMCGTVTCEAAHGELSRFFGQTMQQTGQRGSAHAVDDTRPPRESPRGPGDAGARSPETPGPPLGSCPLPFWIKASLAQVVCGLTPCGAWLHCF